MLEEIDVIVASLLDILLRTILEITSRPQASGATTRLPFQDVTVSPQPAAAGPGVCGPKPRSLGGWVLRESGLWPGVSSTRTSDEHSRVWQTGLCSAGSPRAHRPGKITCQGSGICNREGPEARDGGCGLMATRVTA